MIKHYQSTLVQDVRVALAFHQLPLLLLAVLLVLVHLLLLHQVMVTWFAHGQLVHV
jgi:hypothetical protein